MIIINSNTRQFNIPGADLVFGVVADSDAERKYFQCPRYVGDNLDLAACFIRINYRNANGKTDFYLVDDMAINGDNITFSWLLSPRVTEYRGQVKFVMCAVGPDLKLKWHTAQGTGQVMEGLEPDNSHVESQTADVVAQLISMVEAQTAAVENTGAEQIAAVKTTAKTAQDDVVAQIESKGASTLATIPGDYTAVQNAVRGAANAIRGKVSGESIRVDDVSPMEHYPTVKVHGKNFFFSNKDFTGTLSGMSYSMAKNSSTVTFTGKATQENALSFPDSFTLPKGDYIVSVAGLNMSGDGNDRVYLRNQTKGEVIVNHVTPTTPRGFTLTEETQIRTYIVFKNQSVYDNTPIFIQIEKGDTVTEYTPYIDPTTVKVTRCGKNIIPYPFYNKTKTENGITFTDNGDGTLIANGTATDNAFFHFLIDGSLRVKGKYILSGISGGSGVTYYVQPFVDGVAVRGLTNESMAYDFDGTLDKITMVVSKGVTVQNLRVNLQLEQGDTATQFEKHHGLQLAAVADGTAQGLSAVSPTMTILTDTPGVTIECEYSRDTNKVIAEILEKIAAISG